jgi:hypothetical protein
VLKGVALGLVAVVALGSYCATTDLSDEEARDRITRQFTSFFAGVGG